MKTRHFCQVHLKKAEKSKRVSQNTLQSKNLDSGELLQHTEMYVRVRMPEFEEMLLPPFSIRQVELHIQQISLTQDRHTERRKIRAANFIQQLKKEPAHTKGQQCVLSKKK